MKKEAIVVLQKNLVKRYFPLDLLGCSGVEDYLKQKNLKKHYAKYKITIEKL